MNIKKILIFILLSYLQNSIAQNYFLIPDSNFASYLKRTIPDAVKNNSLNINNVLVTQSTQTINVEDQNIHNLSGIEYFSSLTCLICNNNKLKEIPALPSSLRILNCNLNNLTSLPASISSLYSLECNLNSLVTLPSLGAFLKNLDCSYNFLTKLPTLPDSLQKLHCGYNEITTLPVLPNNLRMLKCMYNRINYFPTFSDSIKELEIYSNPATSSTLDSSVSHTDYSSSNSSTSSTDYSSSDYDASQNLYYVLNGKIKSSGEFHIFRTEKGLFAYPINTHTFYRRNGKIKKQTTYTKDGYKISDTIYKRDQSIKSSKVY